MKNSNFGFTLIELLLYVSLAAIMLLATSVFLSVLLAARVKSQTIAQLEQEGQQLIQLISQTARNAQAINSPASGASASSLSLDVVTASLDPTVFDLSGSTIRITEGAGAAVALTTSRVSASSVSFQNLSRSSTPGVVRIQFTLTHANPSGRNEYDWSKTFYGSASLRHP